MKIGTIIKVNLGEVEDCRVYVHKEEMDVEKLIKAFLKEYNFTKVKVDHVDDCGYYDVKGFSKHTSSDILYDMTMKFLYWLQKHGWTDLLKNLNVVTFKD